jgi:hypothetical protein
VDVVVVAVSVEYMTPLGGRVKFSGRRLTAGPVGAIVSDRVMVPLKPSRL